MALINCSECGKEISDKAAYCIHCGAPLIEIDRTTSDERPSNSAFNKSTDSESRFLKESTIENKRDRQFGKISKVSSLFLDGESVAELILILPNGSKTSSGIRPALDLKPFSWKEGDYVSFEMFENRAINFEKMPQSSKIHFDKEMPSSLSADETRELVYITQKQKKSSAALSWMVATIVVLGILYLRELDSNADTNGELQAQSLIASREQYAALAKWQEAYFMDNKEAIGSRAHQDRDLELDAVWSALPFYSGWDSDSKGSFDGDAFAKRVFSGGKFNNISTSNYVRNWRCLNTDGKQNLLGDTYGETRRIICSTQFDLIKDTRSVENLLQNGGGSLIGMSTRFALVQVQLAPDITNISGEPEVFVNDVLEFDGIVACVRLNRGLFFGFGCTIFAERVQNLGAYSDKMKPAEGAGAGN